MTRRLLFHSILLLFLGQLLVGALGWLLVSLTPWAGWLATPFLVWFIWRIGAVFREELARLGAPVHPGRLALFVALIPQLPSLALLPFWAPRWLLLLWQGAMLPITATLGLFWPEGGSLAQPWLWLTSVLEIGLFVTTAGAPAERYRVAAGPAHPVTGEWAPARRHDDVEKRGRKVR